MEYDDKSLRRISDKTLKDLCRVYEDRLHEIYRELRQRAVENAKYEDSQEHQ